MHDAVPDGYRSIADQKVASGPNGAHLIPAARGAGLAPFPFDVFGEFDLAVNKPAIIKGVIARGETSSWVGPPGSGKSALMTDICVHAAAGWDWRGHKSKARCGAVYFALERADLVKRRLLAYQHQHELSSLPIFVVGKIVNILDPADVERMVATIRAAEDRFGHEVGLVPLDTYAKAIAAGGGDEDKARDQGLALANLRRIQERTGVHVALIGHTGKDESRGARGSNAHLGDVDVMVQIRGNGEAKTAEIMKANDQPEGVLTSFQLKSYSFGLDEDGEPITTAIVAAGAPVTVASKPGPKRLGHGAQIVLKALKEALLECGEVPPASNHLPNGQRAVTVEQLRTYAYRMGVSAGGTRAQQKALQTGLAALVATNAVKVWDPFVVLLS